MRSLIAFVLLVFSAAGAWAGRADVSLVTGAQGRLLPVVQNALAQGAAIDTRDGNGRTALSWAAFHGDLGMMRLLVEAGADLDLADTGGRTPLIWTAILGRPEAARFLLAGGADPAAADEEGRTAADHAEREGHADLARLLREAATP